MVSTWSVNLPAIDMQYISLVRIGGIHLSPLSIIVDGGSWTH